MTKPPAIELVPGIWRIPVVAADGINAFVLVDDDGQATLVDAGLPYTWGKVANALGYLGIGPDDVTRIVSTHAHSDHAGGIARFVELTGAPVTAHAEDAPYLRSGSAPSVDPRTPFARYIQRWVSFPPVPVTDEVADGDVLPIAGGLRVVHTPGHTPGHVSLLHESSGVLITGDAIHNWRGSIGLAMTWFSHDLDLTAKTVHRLGELDYDLVAFTHGPEMRENAREAVRGFLREQRVAA
jgi:glyoxylase-like metal-dependent hydrolase (beta-lactamase superfamily II)